MKLRTKFIESYKKHGKELISMFLTVASLIIAIVSIVRDELDLGWTIVITLVILNSVFLIILSLYQGSLYRKNKSIVSEIDKKSKLHKDFIKKLLFYNNNIVGSLNKFSTQLLSVNNSFQDNENRIRKLSEAGNNEDIKCYIKETRENNKKEVLRQLLGEYDHFLGNILLSLKRVLDEWFQVKNLNLEISVSIKQFDRIVETDEGVGDVKIITTFRDSQTYGRGKREIGEIEYSIDENTASRYCLTKPCFIKNNISYDAQDYLNKNTRFAEFYNCTVVAPIVCKYPDVDLYYGYIACDTLNENTSNGDIFDEQAGDIMVIAGKIIGIYFDEMDFQWDTIMSVSDSSTNDFLSTLYQDKKKIN